MLNSGHATGAAVSVVGGVVLSLGLTLFVRGLLTVCRDKMAPVDHDTDTTAGRAARMFRSFGAVILGVLMACNGLLWAWLGAAQMRNSGIEFDGAVDPSVSGVYGMQVLNWLDWMGVGTTVYAASLFVFAVRRRRWRHQHRCRKCGYDMRQTEGAICPECGLDRTTRFRRPKLAVAAALLMLAWPAWLALEDSLDGYQRYGPRGIVPDWVLLHGMNVLPEGIVLGSAPAGTATGSLVDRLLEYEPDPDLVHDVWAKCAEDLARSAEKGTPDNRKIVLASAAHIAGNKDKLDKAVGADEAKAVIGRALLSYVLQTDPEFDRMLTTAGGNLPLEPLLALAAEQVQADQVPALLDALSDNGVRGYGAAEILLDSPHLWLGVRTYVLQHMEQGSVDPNWDGHDRLLVGMALDDPATVEDLLDRAETGTLAMRVRLLRVLHHTIGRVDRDEPTQRRFESLVQRELQSESLHMLSAALEAAHRCESISQEATDIAARRLFQMLREGRAAPPVQLYGPLHTALRSFGYRFCLEADVDALAFAVESVLVWRTLHPALAHESATQFMATVRWNRMEPRLQALVRVFDDPRWDDADLDPSDWLPAAIERAKAPEPDSDG